MIILPARTWNADVVVGVCTFKIRYRFAGLTKPATVSDMIVPITQPTPIVDIITGDVVNEENLKDTEMENLSKDETKSS